MKREHVEKYLGVQIAIKFARSWFNEAVGEWVEEDTEYVGCLDRCRGYQQEKYYVLNHNDDYFLPTDECCFGPTYISKIRIIEDKAL